VVARWSALDGVGDVDTAFALGLSAQAHRFEHVVEQLTRLAHKGFALQVFLLAWRFANDHPLGLLVAHTKDRFFALRTQVAGLACGSRCLQRGPVHAVHTVGQRPGGQHRHRCCRRSN